MSPNKLISLKAAPLPVSASASVGLPIPAPHSLRSPPFAASSLAFGSQKVFYRLVFSWWLWVKALNHSFVHVSFFQRGIVFKVVFWHILWFFQSLPPRPLTCFQKLQDLGQKTSKWQNRWSVNRWRMLRTPSWARWPRRVVYHPWCPSTPTGEGHGLRNCWNLRMIFAKAFLHVYFCFGFAVLFCLMVAISHSLLPFS